MGRFFPNRGADGMREVRVGGWWVGRCRGVGGGREVRVYVEQDRVDDLGAVNLSTEIAGKISREMRFPGQIRVTVIRELRAVEVAS